MELIVESVAWRPRGRIARRRDDDIVAVRIAFHDAELRERQAPRHHWRPAQKLWELTWLSAKRLGIADRVAET